LRTRSASRACDRFAAAGGKGGQRLTDHGLRRHPRHRPRTARRGRHRAARKRGGGFQAHGRNSGGLGCRVARPGAGTRRITHLTSELPRDHVGQTARAPRQGLGKLLVEHVRVGALGIAVPHAALGCGIAHRLEHLAHEQRLDLTRRRPGGRARIARGLAAQGVQRPGVGGEQRSRGFHVATFLR
jgi:hypothetical protein